MLVDQTIPSFNQFDGRHTATVTHSVVKVLHHTKSRNIGAELQPLWDALWHKTVLLLQSNGFNARDISRPTWAYARAAADGITKVDGRLLDSLAHNGELCNDDFDRRKGWRMSHGVLQH
jgi:hypothetical protein